MSRDPSTSRDLCHRGDIEERVELHPGHFEVVLCADVTEGTGWVLWGDPQLCGVAHISMG